MIAVAETGAVSTRGSALRAVLPTLAERRPLGVSGLPVSPLCFGLVPDPRLVPAAFDMGLNFFFLTADLHWPLYEGLRRGLEMLLERRPSIRDEIVVAVVSYLDQPMFQYLQFGEVLASVRGLGRVDVLVAGAIPHQPSLQARQPSLQSARAAGVPGSHAIGASYHDRPTALQAMNEDALDVHYIRLNSGHPGARTDLFPALQTGRRCLLYNFTSMLGRVTPARFAELNLGPSCWLPSATDYYRYVLTNAAVDGLLCAPRTMDELTALEGCLRAAPLTPEDLVYMEWLSAIANPAYFSN